ncbi:AAA family ATPase [Streptacidiphilus cavernicola]|uniref:AAA family ATPase n=1 Tax=Streptacidiphilus cavernicola TaxID=3342716 RepID=A0ABV6W3X7_9ACTN
MVGGVPGVGKSTAARQVMRLAERGPGLVQWVDVDDLWFHRPWRVDARTRALVEANLRAVADNAARAGVDVLLITWVFQSAEMHRLVAGLLPPAVTTVSVQLRASPEAWRRRFEADPERGQVTDFYRGQYASAQQTPADHVIETDGLTPAEVARRVAEILSPGGIGALGGRQ